MKIDEAHIEAFTKVTRFYIEEISKYLNIMEDDLNTRNDFLSNVEINITCNNKKLILKEKGSTVKIVWDLNKGKKDDVLKILEF